MTGPKSKSIRPLSSPSGPVATFFVALVDRLLGALSSRQVRRLSQGMGHLAFGLGIRRKITLENLRRAFPEWPERRRRAVARAAYVNMAQSVLENFAGNEKGEVLIDNWAVFERALSQKKGVLIATAHFGSWELFGSLMARRNILLSAVVRPLRGSFNAKLMEKRQRSGLKLIAARGALGKTIRALRRGEVVAMLVDQVLPAKQGVFVPFFGQTACTNPALSMAALRTGAPVLLAVSVREGSRLRILVEGPFPLPALGDRKGIILEHTARVTSALEEVIRKYPEQWLWLHRRWKVQP